MKESSDSMKVCEDMAVHGHVQLIIMGAYPSRLLASWQYYLMEAVLAHRY